jgi:serine/threonine protein kinase/formylglycine-generating enzyme required for sulfatase activity
VPPVPTVHELLATLELGETALPSPADAAVGWPDPDATLDAVFGRFRVLGEIGRGGMGRVLSAQDPELQRSVALKVVLDPGEVSAERLARFVAEAQITAQLEHPNIVPVHDVGVTAQGEIYFVMKRVIGRSLRQVLDALRSGDGETVERWTRARLLFAITQVCQALAYAHSRGVIHRDLKPDNVMLGRFGEVLVMDWGVARVLGRRDRSARPLALNEVITGRTQDGAAVGTPGYMSPEQARGELDAVDRRSDVWSLGAMIYEVLTLHRAFEGNTPMAVMFAAATSAPTDPRVRAPGARIPEEIAEICMRAMATEPDDRFASAAELADAVEDFLEGAKRRDAAAAHVRVAEAAWQRCRALRDEQQERAAELLRLEEETEPWTPLEEKAELLALRASTAELELANERAFTEVVAACEKAFSQDPSHPAARELLARAHYDEFEAAEAAGRERDLVRHEERVRLYDDGRYARLLDGDGCLHLSTDPEGAEVLCERYERRGLVWPLVEARVLGTTPLRDVALAPGSYRLTLRREGYRDTVYPVHIGRGGTWDGSEPVPLHRDDEIGEGFVYVPPGPFRMGGDRGALTNGPGRDVFVPGFFVSVLSVTMQEYCAFINALAERDPEEAAGRVPRGESGLKGDAGYWPRPPPGEPYVVPEQDRDGDRWDPRWPAFGVSWDDAIAYARWRTESTGRPCALPTEEQWEKAARGVDGRCFPWGDGWDATLCKNGRSRPGRPQPEPVGGFPHDCSPYGARDLAGMVRDWCAEDSFDGDAQRRVVRGGSWYSSGRVCRPAHRMGNAPWDVRTNVGFRIVRPAVLPR